MTVTFPPLHQSNLWCCASIVVILIVVFLPPELTGLIDARRLCTGGRAFMWLRQLFENNAKDNAWQSMHSGAVDGSKWKVLIYGILLFSFSSSKWIFSNALSHCATINKPAPCLPARQSALLVTLSALPVQLHTTHTHTPVHIYSYSCTLLVHTTQQEFPSSVSQHGRASSSSSSLSSATFLISSSTSTLQHKLYITYTFLLTLYSVICILPFVWHIL